MNIEEELHIDCRPATAFDLPWHIDFASTGKRCNAARGPHRPMCGAEYQV